MSLNKRIGKILVGCSAVLLLSTPVMAGSSKVSNDHSDGTALVSSGNDQLLAGKGKGKGYGPGNGTGGAAPKDGTGYGPGNCTTGIFSFNSTLLLARGGGGNGSGNGGHGPGDGTGNGGTGPGDGSGHGPGTC
jgi:hypothetical protein